MLKILENFKTESFSVDLDTLGTIISLGTADLFYIRNYFLRVHDENFRLQLNSYNLFNTLHFIKGLQEKFWLNLISFLIKLDYYKTVVLIMMM